MHAGHNSLIGNDGYNRKKLDYSFLSNQVCVTLANHFIHVSAGWIVWMMDHGLFPIASDTLKSLGRCVFAPLPFYAPGSRVRLAGDGPSSWTVWILVARTKSLSKWGTLPGGYCATKGWDDKVMTGGKPARLMEALVRDYSRPDDVVMDPFMGAGTTGLACIREGRKFVGCEIDPKTYQLAQARIERELANPPLFKLNSVPLTQAVLA